MWMPVPSLGGHVRWNEGRSLCLYPDLLLFTLRFWAPWGEQLFSTPHFLAWHNISPQVRNKEGTSCGWDFPLSCLRHLVGDRKWASRTSKDSIRNCNFFICSRWCVAWKVIQPTVLVRSPPLWQSIWVKTHLFLSVSFQSPVQRAVFCLWWVGSAALEPVVRQCIVVEMGWRESGLIHGNQRADTGNNPTLNPSGTFKVTDSITYPVSQFIAR